MNESMKAVRDRLAVVFPYSFHVNTHLSPKMSPIYKWCREQFGDDLVTQFKIKNGLENDTSIIPFLRKWRFDPVDLDAARWEYSDCFFFFKDEVDAILFRLAWPCTAYKKIKNA